MSGDATPAFWAAQPRLPMDVTRFVRVRVERALEHPAQRTLLVWPTVLGAPLQRTQHPDGLPESRLLSLAARMVLAVGTRDPRRAWEEDRAARPDTACEGEGGWKPHALWEAHASRVSLRCGVALLALTGRPEDARYPMASGASLFNHALFHECHDGLERLWRSAEGDLRRGLQGLILLACGYYHQQHHSAAGMRSVWRSGLAYLRPFKGALDTPWGRIEFAGSLEMASRRLEWLDAMGAEVDWTRFWETPSPAWEYA